jgi:hypothetical protein
LEVARLALQMLIVSVRLVIAVSKRNLLVVKIAEEKKVIRQSIAKLIIQIILLCNTKITKGVNVIGSLDSK